jgi:hypothetical protein
MGKLSGKAVANVLFIKSGKKHHQGTAYRETFSG